MLLFIVSLDIGSINWQIPESSDTYYEYNSNSHHLMHKEMSKEKKDFCSTSYMQVYDYLVVFQVAYATN